MRKLIWTAAIIGTAVLCVVLVGCGGGSGAALPTAGDVEPAGKIHEYRGDGCATPKPWPPLVPPPADGVDTTRIPERLSGGADALERAVPKKQVTWFKVQGTTTDNVWWVVTLQPTADEDSDLYMMQGDGSTYDGGATCHGYSARTPTGGSETVGGVGYVPDWVAFRKSSATNGVPSAQVAVYAGPGPSNCRFRIEADSVTTLTVDGAAESGSVAQYQSEWYKFGATGGSQYTVSLTGATGDPDLFVYEDSSTEFVDQHTTSGGGSVTFIASESCKHFIRVYGFDSANTYNISVSTTTGIVGYSRLVTTGDITEPGTGAVGGTVTYDGAAVGGQTVELTYVSASAVGSAAADATATTNASGQYGFANVPPGRYSLTVPAGGVSSLKHCIVASNAVAEGSHVVTPNPSGTTATDALNYKNQIRRTAGIAAVTVDAGLQTGVDNHAHYIVLNHPLTHSPHTEVEGNPGYTASGKTAAEESNIAQSWGGVSTETVVSQIAMLINVPFHRRGHLRPSLQTTAIGYDTGTNHLAVTVANVIAGITGSWSAGADPLLYPTPNQTNVPTDYEGDETPDPLNGASDSDVGYPVTCLFPDYSTVTSATATIAPLGGSALETYLTTPDNPANDEPAHSYSNLWTIVMLPKNGLSTNTTYTVSISATYEGGAYSQTYNFTTGSTVATAAAEPGKVRRAD